LFSEAPQVLRQRALDEIKRLADEDDANGALEVLQQFSEWKNERMEKK
jgi:hypothetical protein